MHQSEPSAAEARRPLCTQLSELAVAVTHGSPTQPKLQCIFFTRPTRLIQRLQVRSIASSLFARFARVALQ